MYTLVVENQGNTALNNLRIFDQLPTSARYIASSGGSAHVEDGITRVEWGLDSLAAGSNVTLTLTVSATTSIVNAQYGVRAGDQPIVPGQAPVLTLISSDISSGQASPEEGGTVTSNSGNVLLSIPSGAVTSQVNFGMVVVDQPINGAGFAGLAFVIQAKNPDGTPVTNFAVPIRLTVNYADSDWQEAGLSAETNLNLFYWAEPNWIALLPCNGCSQDTEANTFDVVLDHLTLFALREGLPEQNHLPLINR